jgi:hypothetical protein
VGLVQVAVQVYDPIELKRPPLLDTPRIIADLRAGDECGDPDRLGWPVQHAPAASAFFNGYPARNGALCAIKQGIRPSEPTASVPV